MLHVGAAALLVAAEDEPGALFQGNAEIPDRLHGVQRGDRGPLVVRGAPAVQFPVLHERLERARHRPAAPGGDDVQMRKDVQLPRAVIQIDRENVMVVIPDGKSHVSRHPLRGVQRLRGGFAERHAGLRLAFFARNADQLRGVAQQLFPVGLEIRRNLLFVIHDFFRLLFRSCLRRNG